MDSEKIIVTCSKRRTSKNQYGSNISLYQCFCGKKYMSYPALYLHAKIKHNLKINSKDYEAIGNLELKNEPSSQDQNESNNIEIFGSPVFNFENKELLKIELHSSYNTLTNYLLEQSKRKNYKKIQGISTSIVQACKEYLGIIKTKSSEPQSFTRINLLLYLLTECINGNFKIFDERFETLRDPKFVYVVDGDCQMIAQFLNFFTVIYLPTCLMLNRQILRKSGLCQKRTVLTETKKFVDWLYEKNYTKLNVELCEQWLQLKNGQTIKR